MDDTQELILVAIDRFLELRRSEWGNLQNQVGEFNPYVTRYDMLQKFRKVVEGGELSLYTFPEDSTLVEQIFQVWKQLAIESVGPDHYWGHPVRLSAIYGHLPWMTWVEFLSKLDQLQDTWMELVPSRSKNWTVGDRCVGAVTFHV